MPVVGTTRRFALLEKDVEVQLDLAQMLLEQAEQIQKQLDHEKDHCEHNAGNVSSRVAIGRAIPEPTARTLDTVLHICRERGRYGFFGVNFISGYVPSLETLLDRFKLPEEN